MTVLHLGVIEQSYSDQSFTAPRSPKHRIGAAKRGKVSAPGPRPNTMTTGDVAELLERQYHIIETFFELHEDAITDALVQSATGALQNLIAGAPGTISLTAEGASEVETMFRDWLSQRGMDQTSTPGVPTKAALDGVSHRFAHPYAKRPSRPSFVDTGLYEANFHAWTDV